MKCDKCKRETKKCAKCKRETKDCFKVIELPTTYPLCGICYMEANLAIRNRPKLWGKRLKLYHLFNRTLSSKSF